MPPIVRVGAPACFRSSMTMLNSARVRRRGAAEQGASAEAGAGVAVNTCMNTRRGVAISGPGHGAPAASSLRRKTRAAASVPTATRMRDGSTPDLASSAALRTRSSVFPDATAPKTRTTGASRRTASSMPIVKPAVLPMPLAPFPRVPPFVEAARPSPGRRPDASPT